METFPFERSFRGATRGWKALGIDVEKSYRDFSFEELPSLWANLEEFVNGDPNVARCVGHYASAIEHGVDPRELN